MSRVILNINNTSGNKNSDNEDKNKKNGGGGNYMNNVLDYMDEIKVGFKFGDGFEKLPSPIANKNYKWFNGAEGPMKNCKVVEIKDNNHLICEMPIEECHLNLMGGLHGSVSMQIIDSIGALVIMLTRPGEMNISTDISTSFYSSAKLGDILEIHSTLLKMGRKLAFIKCEIFEKSTKRPIASGQHTKYFI